MPRTDAFDTAARPRAVSRGGPARAGHCSARPRPRERGDAVGL